MTTFGFELEVSAGASSVLAQLRADGLISEEFQRLHAYHCGCTHCEPQRLVRDGYLFKAQQDCTANGEFITGILEYGSAKADRAFAGMSRALLLAGASVTGSVGNHVHVDQRGMDAHGKVRLARLFARYQPELLDIAAASFGAVRRYNAPCEARSVLWSEDAYRQNTYQWMEGSYLAWKGATVEFRLWNATKAEWRLRTHVGISVAMVHAAQDGVDVTAHDQRCLEDVIGPYMDGNTWAGVLRQRFSKGGFDVAA